MLRFVQGWTAVLTIAGLAILAEMFRGNAMLRKLAWTGVALAAILAAVNHWTGE